MSGIGFLLVNGTHEGLELWTTMRATSWTLWITFINSSWLCFDLQLVTIGPLKTALPLFQSHLDLFCRCLTGEVEAEGEVVQMNSRDAQLYIRLLSNIFIDPQELICWNRPPPSDERPIPESSVILLPKSMWPRALEYFHRACSHRGQDETVWRAQQYFFFMNYVWRKPTFYPRIRA